MAKQLHWVFVSIVFVVRCFLCVHSNIIVINIGPDLCVVDVFIVIFGGQFRHVVCCNSLPTACPLFLYTTCFKIEIFLHCSSVDHGQNFSLPSIVFEGRLFVSYFLCVYVVLNSTVLARCCHHATCTCHVHTGRGRCVRELQLPSMYCVD